MVSIKAKKRKTVHFWCDLIKKQVLSRGEVRENLGNCI